MDPESTSKQLTSLAVHANETGFTVSNGYCEAQQVGSPVLHETGVPPPPLTEPLSPHARMPASAFGWMIPLSGTDESVRPPSLVVLESLPLVAPSRVVASVLVDPSLLALPPSPLSKSESTPPHAANAPTTDAQTKLKIRVFLFMVSSDQQ
jgi:hypothetical protein